MESRYLTLSAVLLATAFLINYINFYTFKKPGEGTNTLINIPLEFEQWRGEDVPLENLVFELLETNAIIHRRYYSPKGQQVFLSIVHYPDNKVDFHQPESCLGGEGITTEKFPALININNHGSNIEIRANQLIHNRNDIKSLIYYFYKADDFIGRSYVYLRFKLSLNKLRNKTKGGSLIRVSTNIESNDINNIDAKKSLNNFIEQLYPFLIQNL